MLLLEKGGSMKYVFNSFVFIALICATTFSLARVPFDTDFVGRTVVFLYGAKPDGTADTRAPIGTGFLIRVPHLSDQDVTVVLVTARHIFDPLWARCAVERNPAVIFVRINTVAGSPNHVRYVTVPLEANGHPTWFKHHDDDVDAAVIALRLTGDDFRTLDFRALPFWRLPTDEELHTISIGDDIVSAGVLLELRDTQRNYPVFKFGKISNIPNEDIPTQCVGGVQFKIRAWLVAANLVPGNSGSPILYYPPFGENSDISSPGLQRMVLIGIQSSSAVPSDIAFMTPANYVFDIIQSMNLRNADLYRGKPKSQ